MAMSIGKIQALKEIIEGTAIAHEFKKIFAAEYFYNEYNEPVWPAMARPRST